MSDTMVLGAESAAPPRRGWSIRRLGQRPVFVASVVVIAAWLVIAIVAPVIAPHDPLAQDGPLIEAPSATYPFGTDELGRDVLSRVLYGARISIPLGLLLVVMAAFVGVLAGGIAGYFGGWADTLLMRTADVMYSFPAIILAMAVTASLGPGLANAVIALTIVSWPGFARVTRSLILSVRTSEYVQASRLMGAGGARVLAVDISPSVVGPVLVYALLDVARAILWLSSLSFLGLAAQPPAAEWGAMISAATQNFDAWWLAVFPGLSILSVVAALNIAGGEVRQLLDPKSQGAITRRR